MHIGFATIGQTPRTDLVPYILEHLPTGVTYEELGIMDGLSNDEIAQLDLKDDSMHMVTRLSDGGSAKIAYELAVPRMQEVVNRLASKADLVVVLCGADWSNVKCNVPMLNLGRLFPNIVQGIVGSAKVGVVKPSDGQISVTEQQYRKDLGLDAVVTSAFPYDSDGPNRARLAAKEMASKGADILWLTCVGMGEDMQTAAREEFSGPIILARSILSRVIAELVS